jgi:hypothetical protein
VRKLRQCGAHLVADNGVTLACHVFESLAVNNNDPATTILNDARLFELAGDQILANYPPPERTVGEARKRHPTARFELLRQSRPDRRGWSFWPPPATLGGMAGRSRWRFDCDGF